MTESAVARGEPGEYPETPIHAMQVAFPIGLWGFALVCARVRLSREGKILE
jgi:uncharacterized membrane protein